MDVFFIPFLSVAIKVIGLYQLFVFVYVILGWLEAFNVVNRYNQFVYTLHTFLFRLIEPALVVLRRFLPNVGGLDISPVVLILIIYFIQGVIERILYRFAA